MVRLFRGGPKWPLISSIFLFLQILASECIDLRKDSFSVLVRAKTYKSGKFVVSYRQMSESYSNQQQRARIAYSNRRVDNREAHEGVFIYDNYGSKTGLLLDSVGCQEMALKDFMVKLGFDSDFLNTLDTGAPAHVVGLARLLFLAEKYKSKLVLLNYKSDHENIPCDIYTLPMDVPGTSGQVELNLYFRKIPAPDGLNLPCKISLIHHGLSFQIYFSSVSKISGLLVENEAANLFAQQADVSADVFSFPAVSQCVDALSSRAQPLFELNTQEASTANRFSFKARVFTKARVGNALAPANTFVEDAKVAYDGRLDTLLYASKGSQTSAKQLINIKRQRMYQRLKSNNQETPECLMSKFPRASKQSYLSEVLLGARYFIFLGRARVAGHSCLFYGASISGLPQWLEQPAEIVVNGSDSVRQTDQGAGKLVVYLKEENLSPVRLSIVQQKSAHLIEFHSFIWDFDHSIRPSEQFTLTDVCRDHKNQQALADIILLDQKRLLKTVPRNKLHAEILAGLQNNLLIPVNMVNELRTSFRSLNSADLMTITFKVSLQSEALVKPYYLGQGKPNINYYGRSITIPARTFQFCLWEAASKGRKVYFAYNAVQRICFVDLEPVPDVSSPSSPLTFVFSARSSYEIYLATSSTDIELNLFGTNNNWWESADQKVLRGQILRSNMTLFNEEYRISNMKIDTFGNGIDSGEALATGTATRYPGVGLIESPSSLKIQADSLNSNSLSPVKSSQEAGGLQMSFENCHASCLSDTACHSFSVCMHGFDVECIVSMIDFRKANMSSVLNSADQKVAFGKKAQVTLEGGSVVDLARHSNCALYVKQYTDLFQNMLGGQIMYWSRNQKFFQVADREECARACFNSMEQVLTKNVNLGSRLAKLFASPESTLDSEQVIKSAKALHDANMGEACQTYYYIELDKLIMKDSSTSDETSADSNEKPEKSVIDSSIAASEAYCSIGAKLKPEEKQLAVLESEYLGLEVHQIKFSLFYEGSKDIYLKSASLNQEEAMALSFGYQFSDQQLFEGLRTRVQRGDNFQMSTVLGPEDCAFTCFTQSLGPWPACKSYDVLIDMRSLNNRCLLNSVALREAYARNRTDLVVLDDRSNVFESVRFIHYEPRSGYALQESLLDEELRLLMKPQMRLGSLIDMSARRNLFTFGFTFSVLVIILALATSGFLVLKIFTFFASKERSPDAEIIIDRITDDHEDEAVTTD